MLYRYIACMMLFTVTFLATADDILPSTAEYDIDATGLTAPAETSAPIKSQSHDYDSINDYLDAIETQEAASGGYDQQLAEMIYGLATTLQRLDRHQDAIDAFKHSMHVNRVNNGLHSLTQEPMMRGIIASLDELGDIDEVTQYYYQLLWTYEQNYGPSGVELIPVLEEASAWHRDIYLNNQTPQALSHLINSLTLTDSSVEITSNNFGDNSPKLIVPLKELALNSYYLSVYYYQFQATNSEKTGEAPLKYSSIAHLKNKHGGNLNNFTYEKQLGFASFKSGRNAYQRLLSVFEHNNAPVAERAQVLAAEGDWLLLFNKKASADALYRQAWQLLDQADAQHAQQTLFGRPQRLPNLEFLTSDSTFSNVNLHSNPSTNLSADTDNAASVDSPTLKFVKISCSVSPRGKTSNFKILESRPADDDNLVRLTRTTWRDLRFRARYEQGQAIATSDHQLILDFK